MIKMAGFATSMGLRVQSSRNGKTVWPNNCWTEIRRPSKWILPQERGACG